VVEELPQQVELLRGKLNLLVADLDLAPAGIDDEIPVREGRALRVLPLGCRTTQDRLDPRDEFARVERLRM